MNALAKSDHIGLLDNGGCVVIVGGLARNFETALRMNPRLVWWDSDDTRAGQRELPTNARAVIYIPKFIAHAVSDNVLRQCRKRNVLVMPVNGTHEIKDYVRRLLSQSPLPAASPKKILQHTAQPSVPGILTKKEIAPKKTAKGQLQTFLRANVRAGGTHKDEGKRLLPIAHAQGLATTLNSLANAIGVFRKRVGAEQQLKAPVSKPDPQPAAAPVDIKSDALALLDDLIAGFQLVREAVVAEHAETRRLKAKLARFQKMLKEED